MPSVMYFTTVSDLDRNENLIFFFFGVKLEIRLFFEPQIFKYNIYSE